MRANSELVAGVDIGHSKVCVVVGRQTADSVQILGVGSNESSGLRRGEVHAVEATAQCLANAIEEAEAAAGVQIESIVLSVSAGRVRGQNTCGSVPVRGTTVTADDVDAALLAATAGHLEPDQVMVHALVREWVVDRRQGVSDPLGMIASTLEARVHLGSTTAQELEHVRQASELCRVDIESVKLDVLAASEAVLTREERELGCVIVDMGAGTTDIAIWFDGALCHTAVIQAGGDDLTSELGVGLRIPRDVAERIKRRHGSAMVRQVDPTETCLVPGGPGRPAHPVSLTLMATLIEPWVVELFSMVKREIELSGYADTSRFGYVLTGGGACLSGIQELAERTLGARARVGIPYGVGGVVDVVRHPKYATAVGLLKSTMPDSLGAHTYRTRREGSVGRFRRTITGLLKRLL